MDNQESQWLNEELKFRQINDTKNAVRIKQLRLDYQDEFFETLKAERRSSLVQEK